VNSIVLSAAADREVRRLLSLSRGQQAGSDLAGPPQVRLAIREGGCNGYFYDLSPVLTIAPEDRTFESRGVEIAIDPASYSCLAAVDLTIDYTEDLVGGAFRFETVGSPERQHCDCGLSFRPSDREVSVPASSIST